MKLVDRLTRLFFIISYLTLNKKTTAKELATELSVSPRTIYRDIDLLSTMEIPIYVQQGRNGGIHILESYTISKALVNDKEQLDILTALKALELTGLTENNHLSNKLSTVFLKKKVPLYDIDFSGWGKEVEKEKLRIISDSQSSERILEFDYTNAKGITSRREVIVINLKFKKNAWYIKAYCMIKEDIRLFKLVRTTRLNSSTRYTPLLYKKAIEFQEKHMDYVTLNLMIKRSNLSRVQEELTIEILKKIDNDRVVIQTSLPTGEWLIHYLLSFGSTVEVITPTSVRNDLIKEINLIKRIY